MIIKTVTNMKNGKANVKDQVIVKPYGKYDVSLSRKYINVQKSLPGKMLTFGAMQGKNHMFDEMGSRRKAYKTSKAILNAKFNGHKHNSNQIEDKKSVKIYNNYRRKNNR